MERLLVALSIRHVGPEVARPLAREFGSIEQIQAARLNFENVRGAVHGQATAMQVSPLPKVSELMSIASLSALLKSAAAAEEGKASSEAEREKAVAILSRVLGISHRETADFKPLQECHAKINELKTAISGVGCFT